LARLLLRRELEPTGEPGGGVRWNQPVLGGLGEHDVQRRQHEADGVPRVDIEVAAEESPNPRSSETLDGRRPGRGIHVSGVSRAVAGEGPRFQVAPIIAHYLPEESRPGDVVG